MVGAWTSCGDTGSAEPVQDGAVGDAEVLADRGERLTGFVHLSTDRGVVVAEDAIARLDAGSSQRAGNRRRIVEGRWFAHVA